MDDINRLLLLAAPTWLWRRCGRHNSPPTYVADFRCPDSSNVSVDTVNPSLRRSPSSSSPRWYHLHSSDVFLVSSLHVSIYLSLAFLNFSVIGILCLLSLPGVIISHSYTTLQSIGSIGLFVSSTLITKLLCCNKNTDYTCRIDAMIEKE